MSGIKLFLLGPPRIERDGEVVEVDTRKATALLAYLAVEGQAFRRDSLAGLLWPEHGAEHARGALRRTLSTVKKALAGHGLVADRATVGLERARIWSDAEAFTGLVERSKEMFDEGDPDGCLALLGEALPLYRADFLAGFSLRDSVDFEDWQYYQAESHKRLMTAALERAIECLSVRGRFTEAIDHARRWLSLDSLHEPAHRKLMLLYAWTGERAAALKQYRECVALLDRELGVSPLEETTELYRLITENQAPVPEVHPAGPSLELVGLHGPEPVPLVGRQGELDALIDAHRSVGPSGRIVLVEGEAGIGKTRLAEDFLDRARRSNAFVATARCHVDETNLAFGVVTDLLRAALQARGTAWAAEVPSHWLSECARLLPELRALDVSVPAPSALDDPGAQARFFEGIANFLNSACAGNPSGVLLVDDLHWIDDSSLDALLYLAGRLPSRPLLLVATLRSEEARSVPRARKLLLADRANLSTHLVLGRLSHSEVSELVAAVRPEDTELGDRLFEETEGLPFFIVEYLAALEEGAQIDSPAWSPPTGVRDLVSSRLERLSETALQVLTTAAVIGRSFDFDTVREAGGRSEDETVTALDELIAAGLVREIGVATEGRSPVFDFSHEGIRLLVYEDTSTARRRLLHRRIAESLARSRRRIEMEPAVIAYHFESAGHDAAADYHERAGEHSRRLFAHAEALSQYRAALALGHHHPARIHEAIADVLTFTGDYAAALTSYETAAALSDQHELVSIEHKIGNVHGRRGDLDSARSHLEVARELLDDGDDARRARINADLSLSAHRVGDVKSAEELAGDSLKLAERTDDLDALAQAHNMLGILAKSRGDIEAALDHLGRSADLSMGLSDPTARIAALNNLALAQGGAGRHEEAIGTLHEALKLCTEQQDRHREAALENNLADFYHRIGDRERSMVHLKQAVAIFAEIGSKESTMQPEIWKLVEW